MIEVLTPFFQWVLGPAVVLAVGRALSRKTDSTKRSADEARVSSSLTRETTSREIQDLNRNVRHLTDAVNGHRREFAQYRTEHAQSHALINEKLTHI